MKVFLSWSGPRSHAVAELFNSWLPTFIQTLKPWISSEAGKGALWLNEINSELKGAAAGIIFVTNANRTEPWLLFETGALAKGLTKTRVCPFLIDLKTEDLSEPLTLFQATSFTADEVYKLLKSLNSYQPPDTQVPDASLRKTFDKFWPDFEGEIKKAVAENGRMTVPPKKTVEDLLPEILNAIRSLERRFDTFQSANDLEANQNWHPPQWMVPPQFAVNWLPGQEGPQGPKGPIGPTGSFIPRAPVQSPNEKHE